MLTCARSVGRLEPVLHYSVTLTVAVAVTYGEPW